MDSPSLTNQIKQEVYLYMIAQDDNAALIYADQLTEGDIIRHFTGEIWKVISEPKYTDSGISFEVLCLDLGTFSNPNTQLVVFASQWRFESIDYQPLVTT